MEDLQFIKDQVSKIINLYNSKRYEEVIRNGNTLIKKFPNQIIFYNAVSLSLSAIDKHEEGLVILRKAINLYPNNIHVINNIGLLNQKLNQIDNAREYFSKALSINNNFIDALVNLGNLELSEKNFDRSETLLNKAIEISKSKETDEVINMALGNFYQQTGKFKKAMENFKAINKLNPNNTSADKSISLIHKYKDSKDPHLKSMEKKLELFLDNENKQKLYFALSKAYEDIKDFQKSFLYTNQANKIADENYKYNINEDIKLFTQIKNLFKNDVKKHDLKDTKKIIFILGMPRSGTTLAEQIISAHKDVYGAGELSFLTEGINKYLIKENSFTDRNFDNISYEKINAVKDYYFQGIKRFKINEKFLTDKAPLNFKWIGFIKKIFPSAKIIHCKRDPMDVCYSNFKNSFQSYSLSFSYNMKKLGDYYNLYEDLISFWNKKYPNEIYNLYYEDLINDQKKQTENLLKFCNLDWDENCLSPHKNNKFVATASLAQVRSPIYKSSIKKWKNFENELSDLKKIVIKN